MATNFKGPYVLRLEYTINLTVGGTHKHHANYNIDLTADPEIGAAFSAITVKEKGGGTTSLSTWCAAWLVLIEKLYNSTDCVFVEWTLWKAQAGTNILDYRSADTISHSWSDGTASVKAGQLILSFRSAEGGIMYLHFMESKATVGVQQAYSALSSAYSDIVDNVLSAADGVVLALDTSYPTSFIHAGANYNNKLDRRRHRA